MHFVDTHCHFDLLENLEETIDGALKAGVKRFVVPSINPDSARKVLALTSSSPQSYAAVGIHPTDELVHINPLEAFEEIETIVSDYHEDIIGIGECGLDFCQITPKLREQQIDLFKLQLTLSQKYNLPLLIHNRKAGTELLSLLAKGSYTGVFHCFSGSKKLVKEVYKLGFYFGISGLLTLDTGLQEVVKTIPLERIVLETDAPYLTPKLIKDTQPWPNKPENLVYTAQKLAELKETDIEEVAKITTQNAQTLFPNLSVT